MEIPIANLDVKLHEERPAENERMMEGYQIAKTYFSEPSIIGVNGTIEPGHFDRVPTVQVTLNTYSNAENFHRLYNKLNGVDQKYFQGPLVEFKGENLRIDAENGKIKSESLLESILEKVINAK